MLGFLIFSILLNLVLGFLYYMCFNDMKDLRASMRSAGVFEWNQLSEDFKNTVRGIENNITREKSMTYEEFKQKYYAEILRDKPKEIRKGQALMNYLASVWKKEYERISNIDGPYNKTNIDCFYNDDLINNTFKHLKEQWKNFPN